ncbi:uncharacterized protein LOC113359412 [Papaver somniferum]|uniref:uncharacterized protein LOC113359412 n=1 Tax=Papaver somniferum TaxID=3469 RepID=UPI000E6FFF52|nr:uncharacterized protein LOC113359412 [Papaver somniferum]
MEGEDPKKVSVEKAEIALGEEAEAKTIMDKGIEESSSEGAVLAGVTEKLCPCGGTCLIVTESTDENRGRYKCPVKKEDGGCGFFELFDKSSAGSDTRQDHSGSSTARIPDRQCECGAGLCKIKRQKRGQFVGQRFYRCPLKRKSCGYIKWVDESKANYDAMKYYCGRGGSCIACGQDGHWAIDCTLQTYALPQTLHPW